MEALPCEHTTAWGTMTVAGARGSERANDGKWLWECDGAAAEGCSDAAPDTLAVHRESSNATNGHPSDCATNYSLDLKKSDLMTDGCVIWSTICSLERLESVHCNVASGHPLPYSLSRRLARCLPHVLAVSLCGCWLTCCV